MDTVTAIVNAIPVPFIKTYGALIVLGIAGLGRVIHSLRAGNGIVGAWKSLLYGTNTPTPPKP